MRRALRLAARGRGSVEPNPMVGCVLVRRGKVIGEGYHRRFGSAHAEVQALRRCGASARGATAYVTLEPCCYDGKTGPCTEVLIEAGVARVVAAMRDPNPKVSGGGLRRLRAAGIEIELGLLQAEAVALNGAFIKCMREGLPWVILKWAQSIDGRLATRTGDSKWISDKSCRDHVHRMRGLMDAIVVGIDTALVDDPMLTCRVGRARRTATRVVLDSRLRLPLCSKLVRTAKRVPTWVFTANQASAKRAAALEKAGCVVHHVRRVREGLFLHGVLRNLSRAGMSNVLVEGGGRLHGAVLDQGLADEVCVYLAPLLIGGRDATAALNARGPALVADAARLKSPARLRRLGDGWLLQSPINRRN